MRERINDLARFYNLRGGYQGKILCPRGSFRRLALGSLLVGDDLRGSSMIIMSSGAKYKNDLK